ncbi:MAG: hypothetical protein IPP80_04005 [Ignavibacteria bacterium]|nr:hypothetical protein [Ignavibacteria bacterium]MBL0321537.1 hypothetical protein [Ignavibacteria bacterium]
MFEKELDRVRKQLKQQLDTRQPSIPLSAILANENVHPAYRAYFRAEAEWWLHEERAIRSSNPRFDTGNEALRAMFPKLDDLYIKSARFDHEELTATIDAAVKTRLNFLVRPRTTLKWFVFRGEPTKPLYEILLRLNYLTDNTYLLEGIRQWAKARPAESSANEILSVVEFERIVEKVDNDAILDLSQDEFVRLLDGIYAFFAEADPDLPPESVPTEAVIIFLDDKGAVPISQALERLLYREELRALTRLKFFDVIDTVIANIEETVPEAITPAPSDAVPAPVPEPVPEPLPEPVPEPLPEPVPELVETEITAEIPEVPDIPDIHAGREERFRTMLDSSSKERVIKKVFNKDAELYSRVVSDVLRCAEWKEAAGVVDRFFARQGVAPDSTAAMEFAQALHRSFV